MSDRNRIAEQAACYAYESLYQAGNSMQQSASCWGLPSVLYKPRLMKDGHIWKAVYGELESFGDSPENAMNSFNALWSKKG